MEAVKIIKGKSYSRVTAAGAQDWPRTVSGAGQRWELSAPLPPGMSISYNAGSYGTGDNIAGTPTTAGTWTGTAELFIYGDGPFEYESFDITVYDSPVITAGQTFSGPANSPIDIRPTLDNSTFRPAAGWSATGLPAGLTLTELDGGKNCKITGTPTQVGNYTVILTAAGASGYPISSQTANSDTETISINITEGPPFIDRTNLYFPGKVGEIFTASPTVTDPVNRPATSWSWEYSVPGLSINSTTGVITGTPSTKSGNSIALTANGPGGSDTAILNIPILGGTPIITSGQTVSGKVGEAFSNTFSLTDATNRPATSWSASGLPSWATINSSTGAITGTPNSLGSFTSALTATGEGGTSQATSVTFSIAGGTPIIVTGQSASGKIGESFSKTFSLTDSTNRPVTSWVITGLPSGLSYSSTTGAIIGTPSALGSSTVTVTANGPGGSDTETATISISVGAPSITAGQSASGKVGTLFSKIFSLTDSTNRPVTSWSASGLPSWATLNTTTGEITGTPQDVETTTISLTATGPGGSDTETATISIAIGVPIISSGQTFAGKVGDAFSANIALNDALDRPATAWAATGLPGGLSINSTTGAISGAPTTIGAFTASIAASNGAGSGAAQSVAFTIEAGAPIIASQTLNGTVGTAFSAGVALTNSANRPATSFDFSGLPSWAATNSSSGVIAGTPTTAGTTTFSVTAIGPGGTSAATNVSLVISASNGGGGGGGGVETPITTMQLVQSQAFTANVGESFLATPQVLSGTPVSWYASDLPDWASISASTGTITGTPTFTGTHYITVTAADANNLSATAAIILTTVSWNTLELFIDPKNRKMLSKANTRSVLSSMVLKRDDRTPFTIVFVKDTTSFSVPSDYNIAVGIKQNYGGEYLAYADTASGLLDLATAPVQALFEDDQEFVDAIFEVKWEDAQSAIRTITLPLKIQNSVILGNSTSGGGTVGGPSVSSSLDRYIAYRQKILTASSAPSSTLPISETISVPAMFHRPSAATFPAKRGWISAVSSVTLDGSALVADQDFVFHPDRQCFYFLDPDTTGDIVITGTATRNFVNFGVTISKSVSAASSTSTSIPTDSPDFQITSVSITSEDMGTETPADFYFDAATSTLFLETKFTADAGKAFLLTESGEEIEFDLPALTDASRVAVPKSLNAARVNQVILPAAQIGGVEVGEFTPFAVFEKTQSGDDILHLGWNYPTGYEKGQFTVQATNGAAESYTLTFPYWPGNAFELPRSLDNVHSLSGATESLIVFDATAQKLVFCKKQSGLLEYTATHKAYEGLAAGGETLEIVAEIPGIYATTAGTGHHLSTLRTLSPSQDWFAWWYQEYGIYFVQIVDEQNVVIYQDDSHGAFENSRPGYTAEELLPLTLKLPFAPLWSLSRRDDTSLFQASFAPDFAPTAFSSATFPELDDTQRYAADSMAAGKAVTLSTNKSIPVRGVQGVNFTGPKPTYYAGATVPYLVLATYKWFVVKCTNRNGNSLLTDGKKYLLCVNNTHFDNRSIMVNITNEGSNIAADLYELKEGN